MGFLGNRLEGGVRCFLRSWEAIRGSWTGFRGACGGMLPTYIRAPASQRPSSAELAEDDSVGDLERPGATRYRIGREGLNS